MSTTLTVKHSLLLFSFLCVSAFCEEFQVVRQLKHDTHEIRGTITADSSEFTVKFDGETGSNAVLSTHCAIDHSPLKGTLCVTLPRQGGLYHNHVPFSGKELLVRRRNCTFELVSENMLLLRTICLNSFKGTLSASLNASGTPCLGDVKYQRLEPIRFGDDFMRTEEEAKQWGQWTPVSGEWKIYSVMERIQANESARIRPGYIPVPDRSPNPFTLSGKSTPDSPDAFIMTGQLFWSDYRAAVTAKPALHSAFGMVFGRTSPQTFWYTRWKAESYGTVSAPLELVQRIDGKDTVRATAAVPLRADNWWRLETQTSGNFITILVDGQTVIRHATDQCPGGGIGLYASGKQETHFDDLEVSSIAEIPVTPSAFHGLANLPQALTTPSAGFPSIPGWSVKNHKGLYLTPTSRDSILTLGVDNWKGQRADIRIIAKSTLFGTPAFENAGLATGHNCRYRCAVSMTKGKITASLADSQSGKTLQTITLPRASDCNEVLLSLDTTEKNAIRVWLDDTLALRATDLEATTGAISILGGKGKPLFFRPVLFAQHPRDWEKPVDIQRFANDPFMQGWASSRYVWLRTAPADHYPQTFNYTGDIYGAFRLKTPVIDKLSYRFGNDDLQKTDVYELSMAVTPADSSATVKLTRSGAPLFETRLTGLKHTVIPGVQIVDEKIGARPKTPDTSSWGDLMFHRDGHVFWLEQNGRTVISATDPAPLKGRAMALNIPAPMDFIHIDLQREHVRDYLFERAESDWTSQGRWEVTNRFACDPRWSHMNGESFGTAALFSKYRVSGDYTIECFAGMRMRQGALKENARINYPRVGDINIAMQTSNHSVFDGYNLIIQAWDPLWSEKNTLFMKKYNILGQNQSELIPQGRFRSPKTRAVTVDWDPGGRPVHGAWYALKIRKTGKRFQAWFDNLQIIDCTDDTPLDTLGHIALWTQHNSIVLARVKLNYTRLELAPSAVPSPQRNPSEDTTELPCTVKDCSLLDSLSPIHGDQSAECSPIPLGNGHHGLLLTNANAGGDFGVRLPLPKKNRLFTKAMLSFDFAASSDARWNLYMDPANDLEERMFVQLTGPAHPGPDLMHLSDSLMVPPPNSSNLCMLGSAVITSPHKGRTFRGQPWLHAEIPLSELYRSHYPWRQTEDAADVIFGMLHEGYLNAGLGGNGAGAWIALANLSIENAPEAKENPLTVTLLRPAPGKLWDYGPIVLQFQGAEGKAPMIYGSTFKINDQLIILSKFNATYTSERCLKITPDMEKLQGESFTFTLSAPEVTASWTVKGNPLLDKTPPSAPIIDNARTLLAYPEHLGTFTLSRSKERTSLIFSSRDNGRPVITVSARLCGSDIQLPIETHGHDNPVLYPYAVMDLNIPDGTYIDAAATLNRRRVSWGLTDRENKDQYLGDLARTPAKQDFFSASNDHFKPGRHWQTVCIPLYDGSLNASVSLGKGVPKLNALSLANLYYAGTQPGAFYQVSNIRFAQSVRLPLTIKWHAKDLSGVTDYAWTWSNNPNEPYNPKTWTATSDETVTFNDLPEGLQFLHVIAKDSNGNVSPATHHPYFVFNQHPGYAGSGVESGPEGAPSAIRFTYTPTSRGLQFNQAKLTLNGEACRITDNYASYDEKDKRFVWNVSGSGLFGKKLSDGQSMTATLSGVSTVDGLAVPDAIMTWKLDFSQDKTPPYPPVVQLNRQPVTRDYRHFNTLQHARGKGIVEDEKSHSRCLDVKANARGVFQTYLSSDIMNWPEYRMIHFRCRIFPKTKANLNLRIDEKWYTVKLNGPDEETVLGTVQGITDDDQWHWVSIDLDKDVFSKIPNLKLKRITRIFVGTFANAPQSHIRLDDIALVRTASPAITPSLVGTDPTGISEFRALVTTDPDYSGPLPACSDDIRRAGQLLAVLNHSGLHFICLQCVDGSGNASEIIRIPVYCDQPSQPVIGDDTLDNHQKHEWSLFTYEPGRRSKPIPNYLAFSDSPDSHSKVLCLGNHPRKPFTQFLTTSTTRKATAAKLDIYIPAKASVTLQAMMMDANGQPLASSKPVTLEGTSAWQRGIPLTFTEKTEKSPSAIGFIITPETQFNGLLLLDNIQTD